MTFPLPRPLPAILADLKDLLSRPSPTDLSQELALADRALSNGVEAQMFRAIELLVLSAHASGMTTDPEITQSPVFLEAVQVLRMSGKPLPPDLPADNASC